MLSYKLPGMTSNIYKNEKRLKHLLLALTPTSYRWADFLCPTRLPVYFDVELISL